MTTDRIGLNLRIKGEIRHRSVANGLQNFQSITNLLAFGPDQNPRIGSDRIDGLTDFLYTPGPIHMPPLYHFTLHLLCTITYKIQFHAKQQGQT